jgi:hypothetical protein
MLSLIVDEGYAYDYLAILMIKKNHESLYRFTSNYLEAQVGKELHWEIITSKEFQDLVEANQKTFDAVEKAKMNQMTAQQVNNCNVGRYVSKTALHKKYFPEKKITEVKT